MMLPMSDELDTSVPVTQVGDPVWPVALLFPRQGDWSEEDYLALDTTRLVELSDGCLEVLPMPSPFHQLIAQLLFKLLDDFVLRHKLGLVFIATLGVRLWPQKIRQPDVLFLRPGRLTSRQGPSAGADLAMEVVSGGADDRNRDLVIKRSEYARAGIPEYWIIDPAAKCILLLVLHGKKYRLHAEFKAGDRVASQELPGFDVDVASVFAVADLLPDELGGRTKRQRAKRNRHAGK
jgi:Uma2 family endonuclease